MTALAGAGASILLVSAYFAIATAFGCFVVTRGRLDRRGSSLLLFGAATGMAALSLAIAGLGFLGWLSRVPILVVLALSAGAALFSWRAFAEATSSALRGARECLRSTALALPLLLLALLVVLNVPQALAPPTDADSLAYHLAAPQAFVDAHRIFTLPWITALQPLGVHMHYTAVLALVGESGPPLVAFGMLLLLLATVACLGSTWYSRRVGLWAAALCGTVPVIVATGASGQVENALAAYTTLAFWCVVAAVQRFDRTELAFAGAFVGVALGIKYYALISLGALGLIVLCAIAMRERSFRAATVAALIFGGVAIAVASPWYVRNAVITGNPFFPEFHGIFQSRLWNQATEFAEWTQLEKRLGGNSFVDWLSSPWNVTVDAASFGTVQYGIGPLPLAFAPLMILLTANSSASRFRRLAVGFVALFGTVWFFFAFQRARHLLPIVPVLLVLAADAALLMSESRDAIVRWTTRVFVAVCMLFALGLSGAFNLQFARVAAGVETRDAYLRNQVAVYPEIDWLNRHLGPGDTVAHFPRTMNFHLRVPSYHLSPFSTLYLDWMRLRGGNELIEAMCGLGVTHVALDLGALDPGAEGLSGALAQQFTRVLGDAVHRSGAMTPVYASDRSVARFRTLDRGTTALKMRVYSLRCGPGTRRSAATG